MVLASFMPHIILYSLDIDIRVDRRRNERSSAGVRCIIRRPDLITDDRECLSESVIKALGIIRHHEDIFRISIYRLLCSISSTGSGFLFY